MYLVAQYKLNELMRQQEDYKWKLAQITGEIRDLTTYAENIADSDNLFGSLFTTPASMYGRQLAYMNGSSIFSETQMNEQMSRLQQNPWYQEEMQKYQDQPAAWNARYQQMQNYFRQQARAQFAKYESRLLHEKEKTLENRKAHIEQSLSAIEKQIGNMQKEISSGSESLFGGGNQRG